MSSDKHCCVPGCKESGSMHKVLHGFPNPEKDRERFITWLYGIGNDVILGLKNEHIYKYRRVCHSHFEDKYLCRNNKISRIAVPKLKLPGIPLLQFPNPKKNPEKFKIWITNVGGQICTMDETLVHKDMRICYNHFNNVYKYPKNRLSQIATPMLYLPGILGKAPQESTSTLPATEPGDHDVDDPPGVDSPENISRSNIDTPEISETPEGDTRESDSDVAPELRKLLVPVPNKTYGIPAKKTRPAKQVLQLRLIDDDGFCDEPVYEVLTDDETEKEVSKKQTATQTVVQITSSQTRDSPSKENDVKIEATFTSPEEKESICEKYKNKEYWKLKLKHILHNTQFCGICLDADVEMNAVNDHFEIIDNERTYRRTLRDIVDTVFREDLYCLANSQICNSCTKKLIQSYIFIHNAEETSKMLNRHLDELYTKTCYIRNNSLKDANHAHSKIYNVVIALDNKVISENVDSNKIKTEKPESDQSERDQPGDKRKLKCVSCNMVLPSYRAWKIHERTTHKQNYRCRICLQSCKTQQDLTTHYKMHLRSRCTFCHRIVQDGELLHHLKTRHKRLIHLCTTCNVAFYSAKALGSHIHECHYRDGSECVTCLKSLSQAELESHQCRFKCPECVETPCVHHKYLTCYREQMMNLVPTAKCLDCRYLCTSMEALIAHVNRQHLNLQPHSCERCGHKFYCKSDSNKHICKSEKVNKYIHICQYCDKEFSNLYFCKRHEKSCKCIQRKYQCDDCPANFDSSKDQMKHRTLKHGKNILSCSLCDRVFLNDLKRKRHELQAHGKQKERVILDCVVCQAKFSSKAALELHMRYHGPDAKYRFNTLRQAHKHRRSFAVCEICGKVISRILFKKHIIAHSDATVSCKTCGKSFQNVTLLRCHQKVHLKSVPCPRCKKLIISAKLWRHFRNHLIRESLDFKVAAIHGLV